MNDVSCPKCGGEIKKNGFVFGIQRYRCKGCGFQFTKQAPHGKDRKDKGAAIALCSLGVSQNQTAKILGVTPTSIARWLDEVPQELSFELQPKVNVQKIEETNLRTYIRQLYIENKENFLMVRNDYASGYEVNIIIKNRNPLDLQKQHQLTVCAFGDSILQGVVHDAQNNKYQLLKENFIAISGKRLNVAWKNYARHGSLISDGEKDFLKHLNSVNDSDYIFFSFGGNDCNFDWDAIASNPNAQHLPYTPLDIFHQKYVNLIRRVQNKGKTPILFSLPPVHPEMFFTTNTRYRNAANILKFMRGDVNTIYQWHSMYNMEIFKIANETNVPIIDITTFFLSRIDYKDFLCDDGVHPNAKGHLLIASAVKDFYEKYYL